MEAKGSVLVDHAVYTKRNTPSSVSVFSSSNNNCYYNDGFLRRSASQQQLLHCHGTVLFPGTRPPMYASGPLPAPTFSSLPPPHLLQQPPCPPLLPLPLSRSFSLPSPIPPVSTRRVLSATTAARSANKDQKKPRSSPPANMTKGAQQGVTRPPHKEPPAASPPARAAKPAAATASLFNDEATKEGGDFTGDVYALSPPPSSLPMPRFSLRARGPPPSSSSPCDVLEASGDAVPWGGGIDAGASDDLRQLLRL